MIKLKKLLIYELIWISCVILIIWLDEILDIPHYILGAEKTPVNIAECIFETILMIISGILIMIFSFKLIKRIKYLEGLLPICSHCKKIRVNKKWIQLEHYISNNSEALFTHSICPICKKKYY